MVKSAAFVIPCSVFSSWSSPPEKPYGQAAAFAVESTPRATRGGSVKMVVAQATTLHEHALSNSPGLPHHAVCYFTAAAKRAAAESQSMIFIHAST